ncbi:UNVERIFIED_CONTAM: hypothetical protein HDU68_002289 [Siphonaria sp. JEL0065]|nr:hypothetical protein HDU68_002289 [Siphonaria sp. JEL0065]
MDVLRITMSAHRHEHVTSPTTSAISPNPSDPPTPSTVATSISSTLGDSPSPSFTSLPPELAARSLSRMVPAWMSNAFGGNNESTNHQNTFRPPSDTGPPLPPVEIKRDSSIFSNLKGLGIFGGGWNNNDK